MLFIDAFKMTVVIILVSRTEHLLLARHVKNLFSFHSNNPMREQSSTKYYYYPYLGEGKLNLRKRNNVPKFTKLVISGTEI